MSEPNQQPDPHDEARDRLTDRILAEALGAESPPDLSDAITSRLAYAQSVPQSAEEKTMQSRRAWTVLLTTAASLTLGMIVWNAYEQRNYEAEIARLAEQEAHDTEPEYEQQPSQFEGELEEVTERLTPRMEAYQSLAKDSGATAGYRRSQRHSSSLSSERQARLGEEQPDIEYRNAPDRSEPTSGLQELTLSDSGTIKAGRESKTVPGKYMNIDAADRTPTAPSATPQTVESGGATIGVQAPRTPAAPSTWNRRFAGTTPQQQPEVKTAPNGVSPNDIVDTRKLRNSERRVGAASVFNTTPTLGKPPQITYTPSPETRARLEQKDRALYARSASESFDFQQDRFRRWPERLGRDYYAPESTRDQYAPIHENDFIIPRGGDALSTFSIDVDTASYSNVRRFLMESRRAPDPNAVRIEELVNYFEYDYAAPEAESEDPFAASLEVGYCPWKSEHRLVRIGVKGREIDADKRPLSNLVFLVDVSGSMNQPNKLPLVIEGLKALTDKLGENDRVAIVVYAGSEGVVLPSTSGEKRDEIRSALGRLTAGGSTAGGAGLKLAYEIAERNRIVGGVNRVVLCTDGDFNVGLTGTEELAKLVETRAKETGVFLTVLGFGSGNLNDAMLETISGRGDGHYAYIDSESEARRVLSRDLSGTLVTIAKDVKIQVEFNPAKVASYRLIGYENRVLAAEDFNDDTKDAGEIGAGHTVTALYEVVPVGVEPPAPPVDGLKYQPADGSGQAAEVAEQDADGEIAFDSNEMLTLKIRYKQPEGGASKKLEFPLEDPGADARLQESIDFRWAASVAEFGMLLRNSRHRGEATYEHVLESARTALGEDPHGYRSQMLDLVRRAQELSKGVRR